MRPEGSMMGAGCTQPDVGIWDGAQAVISDAVHSGAGLLDRCFASQGWAQRLNLDSLDLPSSHDDVLGQLFGDFTAGWAALEQIPGCTAYAEDYGFQMPSGVLMDPENVDPDEYADFYDEGACQRWAWHALRLAWVSEVTARTAE